MAIFNSGNGRENHSTASIPPSHHAANGKRGMFSVIGPDVVITGNVAATADLHVDGRIDGDIDCGNLVQGPDSLIKGAVKAETARIAGAIQGSVRVRQLTVERAARISGDVDYETLTMETGATIDGRLKHLNAEALAAAPVAALAAPADAISDAA